LVLSWVCCSGGLTVTSDDRGQTTIAGPIADQAALHGLLARIRDLGLELLLVRRTDPDGDPQEGTRCARFGGRGASIDRHGASSRGWPGGHATVGWGARWTGAPP